MMIILTHHVGDMTHIEDMTYRRHDTPLQSTPFQQTCIEDMTHIEV